jgi:hypothetical protein
MEVKLTNSDGTLLRGKQITDALTRFAPDRQVQPGQTIKVAFLNSAPDYSTSSLDTYWTRYYPQISKADLATQLTVLGSPASMINEEYQKALLIQSTFQLVPIRPKRWGWRSASRAARSSCPSPSPRNTIRASEAITACGEKSWQGQGSKAAYRQWSVVSSQARSSLKQGERVTLRQLASDLDVDASQFASRIGEVRHEILRHAKKERSAQREVKIQALADSVREVRLSLKAQGVRVSARRIGVEMDRHERTL